MKTESTELAYTLDADDGVEVRRADTDTAVGYLPARFCAEIDTDDPAAVMAAEGYRELDEDGDVTPHPA